MSVERIKSEYLNSFLSYRKNFELFRVLPQVEQEEGLQKKSCFLNRGSTGEICFGAKDLHTYYLYEDKYQVPVDAVEDHFGQCLFVYSSVHKQKRL